MRRTLTASLLVSFSLLLGACSTNTGSSEPTPPQRTMGVSAGPERVFDEPIESIVPALEGARAIGRNGRVGPEFVFWSYRLADGREAWLHGCADIEGVNCEARLQRMCPYGQRPTSISTGSNRGNVVHRNCEPVGLAAPGELRPGCRDREQQEQPIIVGLAICE